MEGVLLYFLHRGVGGKAGGVGPGCSQGPLAGLRGWLVGWEAPGLAAQQLCCAPSAGRKIPLEGYSLLPGAGILLRRLLGEPTLQGTTHVVLDEVHEVSWCSAGPSLHAATAGSQAGVPAG